MSELEIIQQQFRQVCMPTAVQVVEQTLAMAIHDVPLVKAGWESPYTCPEYSHKLGVSLQRRDLSNARDQFRDQ